jgi:hypothetical protein
MAEPTEDELVAAWRAAEKAWHAAPFDREKGEALEQAMFRLRQWRRVNTPEGRAYADSPTTYADDEEDDD